MSIAQIAPKRAPKPSVEAEQTWTIAKGQFQANVGSNNIVGDGPASFEEAQKQLETALDGFTTSSTTYKCLAKLRPLFSGLGEMQYAIDSFANADPHGIANLVWGTARLFMKIAQDYVQFFEDVSDAIETMGQRMARLKGYRDLVVNNIPLYLHESLTQVFLGYSEFYHAVNAYLNKRRSIADKTKRFLAGRSKTPKATRKQISFCIEEMERRCNRAMDDAYLARDQAQMAASSRQELAIRTVQHQLEKLNIKDQEAHIRAAILSQDHRKDVKDVGVSVEDLRDEARLISDAIAAASRDQQEGLRQVKTFIEEKLENQRKDRWQSAMNQYERIIEMDRRTLQHSYLQWIRLPDVDMEGILHDRLDRRLQGTGDWMYEDGTISQWLSSNPDRPRMLWLKGDPGFGKTFLTAHIISALQRNQPTGVAYFFCSLNNEPYKRTVNAILRTWLHQLLKQVDAYGESVVHFDVPDDRDYRNGETITIDVLFRAFRKLFRHLKPTKLVVDGFDEVAAPTSSVDRRNFVEFFKLLSELPEQWKALLVSRPNEWFKSDMLETIGPAMATKEITVEDTEDDLTLCVSDRL